MKLTSINNLFSSRRTVARDLLLWLSLAVSLTIILTGVAYYYFSTNALNKSLHDQAQKITEEISNVLIPPLFNIDDDVIQHTAAVYMASGRLAGIRIESTFSGVIFDSLPAKGETLLRLEKTIAKDGLDLGKVVLVFNDREIRDLQRRTVWITLITIIAVLIVNAFVIRRIMHFLLIAPLARLNGYIEDIANGAYQGRLVHVPQNDLNRIIVTANRMSEQINMRTKQLSESELRYREIFNATNESILIHDAETGDILDVNQTMSDMYGYIREEAIKLKIGDLSSGEPPYTQEEAVQKVRKAVEEGPQVFEWMSRRKNGELFWVEVALKSSEIGGQDQVLAVVRDISDRKQAEKELMQEKTFTDAVINSLPGVFYVYDKGQRLIKWNKAHETRTGYSAEELSKMHPLDWVLEEDKERITAEIEHVFKEGETSTEATLIMKDGRKIPFYITGKRLEVEGENYLIGVGIDITDRKKVEEELERHQTHLEDLVKERTKELEERTMELERYNKLFVKREFRIKELKDEIKRLKKE